ncbi:MAG: hypothetical protein RLZZ618_4297 [Pseudomonadota bacterium]|jgi:hypothetical protein
MSTHREPIPPGQPEPGELPVEPDSGALIPTGTQEDDDELEPGRAAPV